MSKDALKKAIFRQFEWNRDFKDVLEWDKEMKQIDHRRYLRERTRRTLQKEYRKEPEGLLILECNDQKAGFLWLNTRYDIWKDDYYIYLHFVFIAPEFRGKGLGRVLMEKAEEYARSKGVGRLYLGTHGTNTKAHKLYEGAGFERVWVNYEKTLS